MNNNFRFIDTTLASADALRFERIQGHCSAWCLEELVTDHDSFV